MSTIVCFHAHPDDEAIATGGVMVKAKSEGHRVVLVVATRGEHGEVADGFLAPGEQLGLRRVAETFAAAAAIGVDRVEFLGYVDSGMVDTPTNDGPYAFCRADVDQAAHRLVAILDEESADVLTIYDEIGGYHHPDHVQVHLVGARAAELRPATRVFQSTMNRDAMIRSIRENADRMSEWADDGEMPDPENMEFGMPESRITHAIDVAAFASVKRGAMRAHASQISEENFFLKMPEDVFADAFGVEWFIELHGTRADGAPMLTDLFAR